MKKLFSILLLMGVMSCSTLKEESFDYGQYIDNKKFLGKWVASTGTSYIDNYTFKDGHQILEIEEIGGGTVTTYRLKNSHFDAVEHDFEALGVNLYYYKTGATKYSKRIKVELHRVSSPHSVFIYDKSLDIMIY